MTRFGMILTLLVALCMVTTTVTTAPALAGSLSLAVYNDGRVLVREVRSLELPAAGEVLYGGVPETIRPETLAVRSLAPGGGLRLLEAGYRPANINAQGLLERFVGQEVQVVLPDPADTAARVSRKAVLLSAGPQPVLEMDGKIYIGPYESLLLPALPKGMNREPVLRWLVSSTGPKRQNVEVSYLAGGMGWQADYALMLDPGGTRAGITAWASIHNGSGVAFRDAKLKLVAGAVNRAPAVRTFQAVPMAKAEMSMAGAAMDDAQERGVGEYHLYEVPRAVTLERGESRQVRLFSAPAAKVRTELVSSYGISMGRFGAEPVRQGVGAFLLLDNVKKSGLGMPLPAGTVRVYQQDTDGGALLLGEDGISHTAPGAEVRLRLGSAFDITVERVQTAYVKTGKNSVSMTWEITVRNGSDRERQLTLQERFHGEWKISGATMKYRTVSSGAVEYDLVLPKGGGATTLRYTVDLS